MRNETTYDCANRMIQKTLPADGVYKYTYDIRSALTKIKEPEGGKTTYTEASRTSPRRWKAEEPKADRAADRRKVLSWNTGRRAEGKHRKRSGGGDICWQCWEA